MTIINIFLKMAPEVVQTRDQQFDNKKLYYKN